MYPVIGHEFHQNIVKKAVDPWGEHYRKKTKFRCAFTIGKKGLVKLREMIW